MNERTKKVVVFLLKAALVIAVVSYVLASGRLDLEQIAGIKRWWLLVLGGVAMLATPFVGWIRWWVMLRAQGIRVGLYEAFRIQMIGVFFNSFLFGATGGDVFKAYYIATGAGSDRKAQAAMTVLLDRAVGVMGLFTILIVALPIGWSSISANARLRNIAIVVGALYGTAIVVLAIAAIPRFRKFRRKLFARWSGGDGLWAKISRALNGIDEAIQQAVQHPVASLACMLISTVAHMATVLAFYLFGLALSVDTIPFTDYALLAPIALAVNALPVFPAGGLGPGEFFASIVFCASPGIEPWVGGTILFLWRLGRLVPAPIGLTYFLMDRTDIKRVTEQMGPTAGGSAKASGDEHPRAGPA